MEVGVLNRNGEATGRTVVLSDEVFGIEPNDHAIYLDVRQYLAQQRQGTAKTKERSELSGSTRKLIRQKGSGGARRGDINSPVLRGGARVFGPQPRDYSFKLNKKLKQLARRSALSQKAQEDAILVLEDYSMEAPKTKEFKEWLGKLSVEDKKVLLVLSEVDKNVYLSARNLGTAKVMTAVQLNTYSVLDAQVMIITEKALEDVEKTLGKKED